MYEIKQTINHKNTILARFDNIAKAKNFLSKYIVILKKRDPHLVFDNNKITVHVPVERTIQIIKKAS